LPVSHRRRDQRAEAQKRYMERITRAASSAYCRRVGRLLAFASLLGCGVLACSESNSGSGKPLGAAGGAAGGSGGSGGGNGGNAVSSSGAGGATGAGGADAASTSTAGGAAGNGGVGGSAGAAPSITYCVGKVYNCGDALDNDGDGLTDSEDPECLSPCGMFEDTFYSPVGDPWQPCVVDCYFDGDSGSGNDDCRWSHTCDPHEVPPTYYPSSDEGSTCAYDPGASIPGTTASCSELAGMQSATCMSYCGPLTPNGCDCFGCCEVATGSGLYAWLGSTASGGPSCSSDTAQDPAACHPCTPVMACLNPCDACELCVGKSAVPAGCTQDLQCSPGTQPCGLPGQANCPQGQYCVTGCCRLAP
jgi:hypothetical protein